MVVGKKKQAGAKLMHHMRKGKTLKSNVCARETPTAKRSELSYKVIDLRGGNTLVEVTLSTGRFHQIRAKMAFINHPIMGDTKYGSPDALPNQELALYSFKLVFITQISSQAISLTAP